MPMDLLLTLLPGCHLGKFVLVIGCGVCQSGTVDVKPLGIFQIEVVCCAIKFDEVDIMACKVKLREVKMLRDLEVDENTFAFMKV